MEATYPLCHKEPARSKQSPFQRLVEGFGSDELVLYGIRELAEQHHENISVLKRSRPMRARSRQSRPMRVLHSATYVFVGGEDWPCLLMVVSAVFVYYCCGGTLVLHCTSTIIITPSHAPSLPPATGPGGIMHNSLPGSATVCTAPTW